MKKILAALFIFTAVSGLSGCDSRNDTYTRSFFVMDTGGYITVDKGYEKVCDDAVARLYELEALLSATRNGSDIYKLNNADGNPVVTHNTTRELIDLSLKYHEKFPGFDISLKNLSELWSFTSSPRVPDPETLGTALSHTGMNNIRINGNSITLENGVKLDLGGVAKGYAVSLCAELLRNGGTENAVIDIGGNIYVMGKNPRGKTWRVGVKMPFADDSSTVGYIEKSDTFYVTTGVYERYFQADGRIYHHVIDPKTGCPFDNGLLSVLVVTDNGRDSDILSTALFTAGLEAGLEYAEATDGLEALFITDAHEVYITAGLSDIFVFTGGADGYVFKN